MSSIAIITARGGSKRIPQKNIKEFCGKPIIAYSIEAALKSGIFEEVMVSTDSEEIASIAKKYGASVPFYRSEKTSSDYATTADVLEEVLECYEKNNITFETMCCIYPTAPFVTSEKLKAAYNNYRNTDSDSLMTVVQFSFPPQRGVIFNNEKIQYINPQFTNTRSQDLQPIYHDCGQFYICDVDAFKKNKKLVSNNTVGYVMPEEEVQDIDNLSDWNIAEIKYKTFMMEKERKE